MTDTSREDKITGGAWILEQFSLENPIHERNAARRVLSEVIRAWPGNVDRLWWKWFNEAATSLGLRSKTLDCTVEEAVILAQDGAQLVIYSEDPEPQWLAVLGTAKRKFHTALANDSVIKKSVSMRRLRKMLARVAVDGKLRCAVVQPTNFNTGSDGATKGMKPLNRLWRLLQPEWSDIWIVIVFAGVSGLLALATPIAVEALVNTVAFGRYIQPIVILALILFSFLVVRAAMRALQTYVVEIIQRRLFARVAADLAHRLPRTKIESTDEHYVPELVNRFFDVVTIQKVSAQLLLDGIGLVMGTGIGMAVLGFYHPWFLGFDMLLLGGLVIIVFVMGRGAVPSAIKESKNKYYMAAWLEDIARCPTTFRNDGGREFAMERADRLIHEYLYARKTHFRILMRQILFALTLAAIASTLLLGLGGWLVVRRELTLGQLVAAELIVTTIVGGFAKFGKHMESYYDLLASVDKLGAIIDLPTEREDGMLTVERKGPVEVNLNAVAYSFVGRKAALAEVSAVIPEGARIAIVGDSGSGKSTLMDVIRGARMPAGGHVTIDGFDPRDLRPDVLSGHVAIVRGPEVFHATIEENIHLHREDITASNVRDVLSGIGLFAAVSKLNDGIGTMLTSGGSPLTENQLRLLSIARAAVGGPGLLLIDGVLDGLSDSELEVAMEFLVGPDKPWTLIVSTGREAVSAWCSKTIDLGMERPSFS